MAFQLLNWIEKTSEYYNFSYICTYKIIFTNNGFIFNCFHKKRNIITRNIVEVKTWFIGHCKNFTIFSIHNNTTN